MIAASITTQLTAKLKLQTEEIFIQLSEKKFDDPDPRGDCAN